MTRFLLAALGASFAIASAAPAAAQDGSAADERFHDGKRLMRAGQVAAACEAFADSQALEPNIATLLNLADCREANDELAVAFELFSEAVDQAAEIADEPSLLRVATRRAAALRARVSRLVFNLPAIRARRSFTLTLDGRRVDRRRWDRLLHVDPGPHTVTATADGHVAWSQRVHAPAGLAALIVVAVPPLAPTLPRAPSATPPDPRREPSEARLTFVRNRPPYSW